MSHRQTYTDIYTSKPSRWREAIGVLVGLLLMLAVYAYTSWADARFEQAQPAVVYHSCEFSH